MLEIDRHWEIDEKKNTEKTINNKLSIRKRKLFLSSNLNSTTKNILFLIRSYYKVVEVFLEGETSLKFILNY